MKDDSATLIQKAADASILRIFLDYDGTLADFAPSPDIILPDSELIALMERLVNAAGVVPAIISGRRLAHISKLLPVKGLLIGGTYGIEMQLPDGQTRSAMAFEEVRPKMEWLLPLWQKLIENKNDFYLEDKGWSLALHARFAEETEANEVMRAAHQVLRASQEDPRFRLFEGNRFLEYAPMMASKTLAAQWILDELTPKEAFVIYLGDDDKDEEAFSVVSKSAGFAVRVSAAPCETSAQLRLKDPQAVRAWLRDMITLRGA